jgi:hypothetical protein
MRAYFPEFSTSQENREDMNEGYELNYSWGKRTLPIEIRSVFVRGRWQHGSFSHDFLQSENVMGYFGVGGIGNKQSCTDSVRNDILMFEAKIKAC